MSHRVGLKKGAMEPDRMAGEAGRGQNQGSLLSGVLLLLLVQLLLFIVLQRDDARGGHIRHFPPDQAAVSVDFAAHMVVLARDPLVLHGR